MRTQKLSLWAILWSHSKEDAVIVILIRSGNTVIIYFSKLQIKHEENKYWLILLNMLNSAQTNLNAYF